MENTQENMPAVSSVFGECIGCFHQFIRNSLLYRVHLSSLMHRSALGQWHDCHAVRMKRQIFVGLSAGLSKRSSPSLNRKVHTIKAVLCLASVRCSRVHDCNILRRSSCRACHYYAEVRLTFLSFSSTARKAWCLRLYSVLLYRCQATSDGPTWLRLASMTRTSSWACSSPSTAARRSLPSG